MTLQEEYEIQILGSLMFDNKYFYQTTLTEKHFTSHERKQGFTLIIELIGKGVSVDPFVIRDKIGDIAFDWNRFYSPLGNYEFYHGKLIEFELDRRLRGVIPIVDSKYDPFRKAIEMGKIISGIELVTSGYSHISESITETAEHIENLIELKGRCSGIASGLDCIDKHMSGFQDSEFILIGARPSVGKTALALTLAEYVSRSVNTGFFTLEMSLAKSLNLRLASMVSCISMSKIKSGSMTKDEASRVASALSDISTRNLFVDDTPNITHQALKNTARKMVSKDNVKIIFVDYIGLITPDDTSIIREQQVASISKDLKQLARELDIPIVVLTQLTRDKENKRPSLASIRESGSLEQDADVVIFLHRDSKLVEDERASVGIIPIELSIAKQRNGPVGTWEVDFNQKRTQFLNKAY